MKYIEFKVHASRQGVEQLTAMFMSKGIYELSIKDPADMEDILDKKASYEWDYVDDSLRETVDKEPVVSVYFEDTPENRERIQDLKLSVMMLKSKELEGLYGWDVDFGRLYAETVDVDDVDWKDKWKENFKPLKVTDRLVIKPTWEEYTAAGDELVLELDPGMAFGTGSHETTSLCLKLLEEYLGEEPSDKKILDVGCGSGILSIAAALLGCGPVLGIDIDEDAVRVANENVRLNGVDDVVEITHGDLLQGVDFKADIVVANLMADLAAMLSESVADHMEKGGVFISSGILTEKQEMVENALEKAGFEIKEIREDGEWCAIVAEVGK